jgi:hypothetical protein
MIREFMLPLATLSCCAVANDCHGIDLRNQFCCYLKEYSEELFLTQIRNSTKKEKKKNFELTRALVGLSTRERVVPCTFCASFVIMYLTMVGDTNWLVGSLQGLRREPEKQREMPDL